MRYLIGHLRAAANRFAPSRAVLVALLLGPIIGAILAFEAVAATDSGTVTIDKFKFIPQELTVPVGTTVKWVNKDEFPHTVVENNKTFRSNGLDTDDTFSFTFTKAGTFDYFCSLHPYMKGKIIVQ